MTENEVLKIHIEDCEKRIERIKGFMESNCDADISECCRNVRILEISIQALEEIQQYREIGTVEELKQAKAIYNEILLSEAKSDFPKECIAYEVGKLMGKELREYRAIGTVARFEQLSKQFAPHNVDETSCHLRNCNKCDKYRKENEQYHAIGTVEEFKALKEKAEPKKPIELDQWGEYWECSTCGKYAVDNLGCRYKFCPNCGTKFDWQ